MTARREAGPRIRETRAPVAPGSGRRRFSAWTFAAAGALFSAIFSLALADPDPLLPWTGFYVIPIVLVAQSAGAAWGLAAGCLGLSLVAAWAEIKGVDLKGRGYLGPAGVFAAIAWLSSTAFRRSVKGPAGEDPANPVPIGDGPAVEESNAGDARRGAALRLARLGTWELSLATGEMAWSDEYHDLYGVDPDRFMPSQAAFREIVHREDRGIFAEALERIIRDGNSVEIRYRIVRPSDGAERCIRSHIWRESNASGRPVRVLGTGQDVTDLGFVLSARESQIIMLLAEGVSGEEIAARLVLSPATVRTHIQNAMVKLGAHTRGQAIATALRSKEIGS